MKIVFKYCMNLKIFHLNGTFKNKQRKTSRRDILVSNLKEHTKYYKVFINSLKLYNFKLIRNASFY